MKKISIKALCALLTLCFCAVAFSSCAKPELDFDNAKSEMEKAGYTVSIMDEDLDANMKKCFTAYKYENDGDNRLIVVTFKDAKSARLYCQGMKSELDAEIEEIKLEKKLAEHMLDKYGDDMTSDEIDEYKKTLRECEEKLENYDVICGMRGKTVWYGTTAAVEASK